MTLFSGRRRQHASALVLTLTSALIGSSFALAPPASGNPAGSGLVISEVYGGGGNNGATYTNDFVELYNPTDAAIRVDGMSIQYRSSGATTAASQVTVLSGSVPAGGHYLVQEAKGAGGTTPLPTPDASGAISMGAGAGVVFLSTLSLIHI